MKIFQIFNSNGDALLFCHHDMTKDFPTLDSTVDKFAPNIIIVEAPDYVFEGWGYDATQTGDARFIKPALPEPSEWVGEDGKTYRWMYDDNTGTFYIADADGKPIATEELTSAIDAAKEYAEALKILGVEV